MQICRRVHSKYVLTVLLGLAGAGQAGTPYNNNVGRAIIVRKLGGKKEKFSDGEAAAETNDAPATQPDLPSFLPLDCLGLVAGMPALSCVVVGRVDDDKKRRTLGVWEEETGWTTRRGFKRDDENIRREHEPGTGCKQLLGGGMPIDKFERRPEWIYGRSYSSVRDVGATSDKERWGPTFADSHSHAVDRREIVSVVMQSASMGNQPATRAPGRRCHASPRRHGDSQRTPI